MRLRNCPCPFCKIPDWISKEDHIIETSKFLGYPKCCTEEYLKDMMEDKKGHGVLRHLAIHKIEEHYTMIGVGFVPCKYHADRIVNHNKSVARIVRNRICTTPFPQAATYEFRKYLKTIKKQYKTKQHDN